MFKAKVLPVGVKCFLFWAKRDLCVFQIPQTHCFLVGIICNMQHLLRLGVIGSNVDVNSHPKKIIKKDYLKKKQKPTTFISLETFVSHFRCFWFHFVLPCDVYFLSIDHCSFHFEICHWIILRKTRMSLFSPKPQIARELAKIYQQQPVQM